MPLQVGLDLQKVYPSCLVVSGGYPTKVATNLTLARIVARDQSSIVIGRRDTKKVSRPTLLRRSNERVPRREPFAETVLVVGATGNIGISAVIAALRSKRNVLAIVRNQDSYRRGLLLRFGRSNEDRAIHESQL